MAEVRSPRARPKLAAQLAGGAVAIGDDTELGERLITGDFANLEADVVEFVGCRFQGVDLTGARFTRSRFVDCVFESCELSGLVLEDSRLSRIEVNDCRLLGLQAAGLKAADLGFINCRLDAANFRMSTLERTEFEQCSVVDGDFYSAKLLQATLRECDLRRAQFAKADVRGATFLGSRLDDLQGAEALRGSVIGSDQLMPVALALMSALKITLDDSLD